jgi:endonuclease YncB( thermonuclease family)
MINFVSAQSEDKHYFADIVSIYDGDTFTVMIDLGFGVYKQETIRIARIDTPELRGKEKHKGYESKEALVKLLSSKTCYLIYKGKGKYGRALCEVYTGDAQTNVSDYMLENGYAKKYGF